MNSRNTKYESGQALILIVFSMIGLLAFVALAVDGGTVYFDRRRAQSAADAAALAGAFELGKGRSNSAAITKAYSRASSNGMDNTDLADFNNRVKDNHVIVNSPPADGPYANNSSYVKVKIQVDTQTSLIHFVFGGLARNQVEATARAYPSGPIVPGTALVGMDPSECQTVVFHGGININITGGDVYSNSIADPALPGFSNSCFSGLKDGNTNVTVDGDINIRGAWGVHGSSGVVSPAPTEHTAAVNFPPVPVPVCPTTSEGDLNVNNSDTITIGPTDAVPAGGPGGSVTYDSIDVHGGTLNLRPGLYCIKDGFTGNGGTVKNVTPVTRPVPPGPITTGDDGVMIYMLGGSFDLGGNTVVHLHALKKGTDTARLLTTDGRMVSFGGMLVYSAASNTSAMKLVGTSDSDYIGTLYARHGDCFIGGTTVPSVLGSQVLCGTVDVGGNANVNINFDQDQNFENDGVLDFVK